MGDLGVPGHPKPKRAEISAKVTVVTMTYSPKDHKELTPVSAAAVRTLYVDAEAREIGFCGPGQERIFVPLDEVLVLLREIGL